MKRIYRLFTIVLCCFMLFSCKHNLTLAKSRSGNGSGTVFVTISAPASRSFARNSNTGTVTVTIGLRDVLGIGHQPVDVHLSENSTEQTAAFTEIPPGNAYLAVLVYDENGNAILGGTATPDIITGDNNVQIELTDWINGIVIPQASTGPKTVSFKVDGTVVKTVALTGDVKLSDFTIPQVSSYESDATRNPAGKKFGFWSDGKGNNYKFADEASVKNFMGSANENITLEAKFGIDIADYVAYIMGTGNYTEHHVSVGEEVVVLDNPSINEIPGFNNKLTTIKTLDYVDNITLDFTDCTTCTLMDNYAFYASSKPTKQWLSTLKLPNTLITVRGISYVKDAVYVQLPVSLSKTAAAQRSASTLKLTNTAQCDWSTYALHFQGTLADWCARVQLNTASDHCTGIFMDMLQQANNYMSFYILDSQGNEKLLMERGGTDDYKVDIESVYTDVNGTKKPLTKINPYSFYFLKCSRVTIPDTVQEIGAYAFADCSAPDVYIGSGVTSIGTGALFIWNLDTTNSDHTAEKTRANIEATRRKVYYNGTIDQFMEISTSDKTDTREGGPLRGAYKFFVKENGQYVSAVKDGYITIQLKDGKTTAIKGQFQAYKEEFKLRILPSPNGTGTYTISEHAFYNTESLKEVDFQVEPSTTFTYTSFSGCSSIAKVFLYGNNASKYATNNPFSSSTSVVIYVLTNDMKESVQGAWNITTDGKVQILGTP